MNVLEFEQVVVGYDRDPVLPALDLTLAAGSFLGVVGPNGSGKTTLVRTMLGLLPPLSGHLRFPNRRRPRFGYVPQRESVDVSFPLTALEIVLMGRYGLLGPGRRAGRVDCERARAALAEVGSSDLCDRLYHTLSGGQRQRVLVARALTGDPEILVLDEPTTGMDLPSERSLLDLVASFTSRNMAIIMVSHQLGAVSDYARWLVLVPGRNIPVIVGSREQILTSERLTEIYGHPIAVRSVDGHAVIFVEHECDAGSALASDRPRTGA